MTITLDLAPDIAQGLLAQAQAKGVSITDYVEQIVEREVRQAPPVTASSEKAGPSLVEFFRQSPLVGLELDFERDPDPGRDITL